MKNLKIIKITILSILLLLGCFLVGKLAYKPDKKIIIKFDNIPPVIQRLPRAKIKAYYRGFNIGEVSKMQLCCDQKHVLFFLDIHYKNLNLPKNSRVYLDSEDLYGTSHLSFYYPNSPSPDVIEDGDIIYASGVHQRLDQFLIGQFHEGQIEELLSNLIFITGAVRKTLDSNNDDAGALIKDLRKTNSDVGILIKSIIDIISDPQIKRDIKTSSHSAAKLLSSKEITDAPQLLNKTVENMEEINKNLTKTNITLPILDNTVKTTNNTMTGTKQTLRATNKNLKSLDQKIPPIPPCLLENTNRTLENANCISHELCGILSKRFLLFRLLFGNPAKSLEKCQ